MATTNPRITITISHNQHRILKAMSEFSGKSMSSVVAEFLDEVEPVLERMALSFRRLKEAGDMQRQRIKTSLDDVQSTLEPMLAEIQGQTDLFFGQIERAAGVPEANDSIAPGTPPRKRKSPPTNRGVTPHPASKPKPKGRKASGAISTRSVLKKKGGSAGASKRGGKHAL